MGNNFYASVFNVLVSARDCKIVFTDVNPVIDNDGKVINTEMSEKQMITMPLITAKELVSILDGQIKQYENQFGEIVDLVKKANSVVEN